MAAIEKALAEPVPARIRERTTLERPDKSHLHALQAQVKKQAEDLGIAPEVLATRRDLTAMAAGHTPENLSQGWRAGVLRTAS